MPDKGVDVEWSWSDAPLVLPLAYEPKEWNAIYIALYLAEYSGSKVFITHVLEGVENHAFKEKMKEEIEAIAKSFSVRCEFVEVTPNSQPPGVDEIAGALVRTASDKGAQAIVMSAHREPLFRELFGRVSDHVSSHSPTKVLLVESPQAGVQIPKNPKRIFVPVLEKQHPDPFIIAAALTSSASAANVEITAAKVFVLPRTVPLDAVDVALPLRKEERDFATFTSLAIKTLGRFINPKIMPVREVGADVAQYVKEKQIDILVMFSKRDTGFYSFLTKDEYEIVRNSPCVVIVTVPETQ